MSLDITDIKSPSRRSDAELGIYRPLIMCGGACGWSRHMFDRNQRVGEGSTVNVIYVCRKCMRERIYGNGASFSEFASVTP